VPRLRGFIVVILFVGLAGYQARTLSQSLVSVTSPLQEFGAHIGDDYFLATYSQFERYWKKVDAQSDRIQLASIGQTEEGRTQWMAIVSAPENLANLDRYRTISRVLASGAASEREARALAAEGKAIVWIDGGLHADEVLGAQQLIELVYQLASADDPETLRFLHDTIVLVVHANPDGHALVADWYMREREPLRRTLDGLPRTYQKYIGHDNNRDFFMSTQAETINMNRVLYKEWFPQIVLDHHQPGPPGTVMFAPPFSGPANAFVDPLVSASVDRVGEAMQARFAAEGKRGVTMRAGASYSTWWNGGLRTSAYFHNQIGLLTETSGDPAPILIAGADPQIPTADLPLPIAPQRWHLRQSVEYEMTANRAVLDYASRFRETLLLNAYRMARNGIEGRADNPAVKASSGYILPSSQPDFGTATKFVDALLKSGIIVDRAVQEFRVNGVPYPAGSFVVKTAQPFRAHVLDMFEPQRYPGDESPYDIAGWTLALQMGVKFDRIAAPFDGEFERIETVAPPRRTIDGDTGAGFLLSHQQNDSAVVVNRLLRDRAAVSWLRDRSIGSADGTGSIYVAASARTREIVSRAAAELGVSVTAVKVTPPSESMVRLRPVRIALWEQYGGAPSSGWIRWLLERYEFPFDLVYVQAIDAGLSQKYDVVILPDDAQPRRVDRTPLTVPSEYRTQTGVLTAGRSVPALRRFVEEGGTVVLMGQAAAMAPSLGAAVERIGFDDDGRARFSVPGSILRVRVDNTSPIAYGFEPQVDVFFNNDPMFRLTDRTARGVARFDASPLRSGWARGQQELESGLAAVDATVGRGRVIAFGPQVAFRGQSHATFKFLFNAIYYSRAEPQS
jgi:hypothetical protein